MKVQEIREAILDYRAGNSYYQPSNPNHPGEVRKAQIKNWNLPILNFIYNGDPNKLIKCMISGRLGFIKRKRCNTGQEHYALCLEFNHICQQYIYGITGKSVHKGNVEPSSLIRRHYLTNKLEYLDELLKCMPVSKFEHSCITNDSQYHDIDLSCFPVESWPWVIRCRENYEFFIDVFDITDPILFPDYNEYMKQFYFGDKNV